MVNQEELNEVFRGYKRATNMSFSELKRWSEDACSKKASLDRSPIKRNLRLLSKNKSEWKQKDIEDAKRTISFLSRMKNVPAGQEIGGCGVSKRTIALKNWAFDPNKNT